MIHITFFVYVSQNFAKMPLLELSFELSILYRGTVAFINLNGWHI